MKKLISKIVPVMVVMLFVIALVTTVNAASANVSLTASKSELKPGDTFTVTFKVSCDDGINGLSTKLSYDTDKLELSGTPVIADKFTRIEDVDENTFSIIDNGSKDTTVNMITFTFKVKANAEGTAKIQLNNLLVDPNTGDSINIGTKECTVTINNGGDQSEEKTVTGIEITKAPNKTTYTEGEKFDPTGMVVVLKYSDGTKEKVSDFSGDLWDISIQGGDAKKEWMNKLPTGVHSVIVDYGPVGDRMYQDKFSITVKAKSSGNNVNVSGDNTVSDKEALPKTGASIVVVPMVIIAMAGVGAYIRYKNTEI